MNTLHRLWIGKGKVHHTAQESIGGCSSPEPVSLEPVGGEPLMSVTHGQCDARPMVTLQGITDY